MTGNVTLSIVVPANTCYESPAVDWPKLVSNITANLTGSLSTVNSGTSTPAAADRDKPWLRSNADGSDDGQWVYYNGFWVQKHPAAVGLVAMYEGALADITTFDGGEVGAVTNMTGAFWEEVTAMRARSPIHPGTLASGTIINIGDDLGEEKHLLIVSEMPAHIHEYDETNGARILTKVSSGKVGDIDQTGSLDYDFAEAIESTGGDTAHNTIHPVRGIFFIRRTARLYRRRNA
jgi:hypothetical protein